MSLEQEDRQFRELTEFDANSVLMQITTNEIGYESSTEPLLKRGLPILLSFFIIHTPDIS